MTQKLDIGKFDWDNDLELSPEAATILQFKDINEIEEFIESYREPISSQIDSLRNLL
jgi:hypothetical protein